jgi:hypothetical protein
VLIEWLARAFVFAVGAVLAGFGLICLRAAAQPTANYLRALGSTRWSAASGRITRSVVAIVHYRGGHSYSPRLSYVFQVDGQSYRGTRESFGSGEYDTRAEAEAVVQRLAKDTSVTVLFDPSDPHDSVLDDRRPPLFRFFQLPLCIGTSLFLGGGVAIIRGNLVDTAPFPRDGLPPLAHQIAGLLLALGGLSAFVATIRVFLERHRRRLARQIEAAPLTPIASAREGQTLCVYGRAERTGKEISDSPFSTQPLVYEKIRVFSNGKMEILTHTSDPAVRVRDDTGTLLVLTADATDEVLPKTLSNDEKVTDWVDQSLTEIPPDFSVEYRSIAEGSPLLAVGVVQRDHQSRELVLRKRSLLFSDQPRDELLKRLKHGMLVTRLLAGVAVAALLAGCWLLR